MAEISMFQRRRALQKQIKETNSLNQQARHKRTLTLTNSVWNRLLALELISGNSKSTLIESAVKKTFNDPVELLREEAKELNRQFQAKLDQIAKIEEERNGEDFKEIVPEKLINYSVKKFVGE